MQVVCDGMNNPWTKRAAISNAKLRVSAHKRLVTAMMTPPTRMIGLIE